METGKTYKCRNGKTALITHDISDYDQVFCIGGRIYNADGTPDRLAYWTKQGNYNIRKDSEFDIVSACPSGTVL